MSRLRTLSRRIHPLAWEQRNAKRDAQRKARQERKINAMTINHTRPAIQIMAQPSLFSRTMKSLSRLFRRGRS